jgi:hypothetical protein
MKLFKAENQSISYEELEAFETTIALSLPKDYKAHMLQYNGGSVSSIYVFFGEPDDGINLFGFYPIKYGTSLFVERKDYLPEKYIGIGRTGTGYLAMSLNAENYGNIFVHYSDVKLEYLASSFTEFVNGLTDYSAVFNESI